MKNVLAAIGLFLVVYIFAMIVRTATTETVTNVMDSNQPQDAYDAMLLDKAAAKKLFVDSCVSEAGSAGTAYCGCTADNVLAADRETFNALMIEFSSDNPDESTIMTYAEPCFYLMEEVL